MSGDAHMILGDWLSLCNPGALSITCRQRVQDEKARVLIAGTLVHMLIMHMYGTGRTYTQTVINICVKRGEICHTITC